MRRHTILLGLVIGALSTHILQACPACNIFNYLGTSVLQSSNIVVGKLIGIQTNSLIRVEVIRTLQGHYNAKQVVEMRGWADTNDIGKEFIFSDPHHIDPDYPMLDLSDEDEVQFLIRLAKLERERLKGKGMELGDLDELSFGVLELYKVKDEDEAIQRTQGWSNQSWLLGLQYLRSAKPFPLRKILTAIEQHKKELLSSTKPWEHLTRAGSLLAGLLLSKDPAVENYILIEVQSCLGQKDEPVNWTSFPYESPARGEWLAALLGLPGTNWTHRPYSIPNPYREKRKHLVEKEKQLVLNAIPKLKGQVLSEAVYALYESRLMSAAELVSGLKDDGNKNEIALGLYWSLLPRLHIWVNNPGEKPLNDLQLIDSITTQP
jgi:hypothetical protein